MELVGSLAVVLRDGDHLERRRVIGQPLQKRKRQLTGWTGNFEERQQYRALFQRFEQPPVSERKIRSGCVFGEHRAYSSFNCRTNERISNRLISRPGKKLLTASTSSSKTSKIVSILVSTSSSRFRRFRCTSFEIPPDFFRWVEHITMAPRPVLST